MRRLAPVVGPALAPALAIVAFAGCGRGHESGVAATTTTAPTSVPTTTVTATTVTANATSSTAPAPSTTATTAAPSSVRISRFDVSPPSPVQCNAETTMIQLEWSSIGATSVDLSIDGRLFASYGGGDQDHFGYLTCDGAPHTYLLTARNGSTTATSTRVLTSASR